MSAPVPLPSGSSAASSAGAPGRLVCTVEGSRSKAVVPAHLLADRPVETFFRELLRLRPDQRVVIRRVP